MSSQRAGVAFVASLTLTPRRSAIAAKCSFTCRFTSHVKVSLSTPSQLYGELFNCVIALPPGGPSISYLDRMLRSLSLERNGWCDSKRTVASRLFDNPSATGPPGCWKEDKSYHLS